MELGVLELGLKNKQIRNVNCFLKIQVEYFRVRWSEYCKQPCPQEDGSELFLVFFKQWEDIFTKISTIIKSCFKESVSNEDKRLGHQIAKISLQACNLLLSALDQECDDCSLQCEANKFTEELTKFMRIVRNSVGAHKQIYAEIPTALTEVSSDKAYKGWQNLDTNEIVLDGLCSNRLPLSQYYIHSILNAPLEWKEILDLAFENAILALRNKNMEKARKYLLQVNLPVEEALFQIFLNVFDPPLKEYLCQQLENSSKTLFMGRQHLDLVNLLEQIYKTHGICFNVQLTRTLDGERLQNMMLTELTNVDRKPALIERCLKHVTSQQCWISLASNYDIDLLLKWANNRSQEKDRFPFGWPVTGDMLSYVYTSAPEFVKEKVLTTCASRGQLSDEELKSVNTVVRRLVRVQESGKDVSPLWFKFPDDVKVNYDPAEYQLNLIEAALQNNLHYFLYWYCSQEGGEKLLESTESNPLLRSVLQSCLSWENTPENHLAALTAILACAQYVYSLPEPVTIQSLIDNGLHHLALFALQYSPTGFMSAGDAGTGRMWSCNRNSVSTILKANYPLLYQAFTSAMQCSEGPVFVNSSLSIYKLLKDSTMFDISKMFNWQNTNIFGNVDESSVFSQLPSFSHSELAKVYGLKANLTFTYYLSKGRALEAYVRRIRDKGNSSKSVESACKKACLLAYYNSEKKEITAACVYFVQMLTGDSYALRLHLSVINLIMAHASRYVGLNVLDQVHQLGNLTKRACYQDDKRAAIRLLHYIMTAFEEKYNSTQESLLHECFEYKIAVSFATFHKLELPEDYLVKCGQSDNWLLFTVFAQMYDYPREVVLKLLSQSRGDCFNNRCIAEHLEKAFQSSHVVVDTSSSESVSRSILKRRPSQHVSATHLRNVLLDRMGFRKGYDLPRSSTSPHRGSSEDDKTSYMSEADFTHAETMSIASTSLSSEFFESANFNIQNPPKDFFSLLLLCQKQNPTEPWKSLLVASVVLSNPVAALFAAAVENNDLDTYSLFDCFCCWLYASFELPSKQASPSNEYTVVWSQKDFLVLLRSALLIPKNFFVLHLGLQLFELELSPLIDLARFFIDFLIEKDLHNFTMLKSFQEKLWTYKAPQESNFLLHSKNCIEEASVTMMSSGLEATTSPHQLHVLLRHFDVSRVQLSFSPDINVPDFKKMYKISQCVENTSLKLNVSQFMDLEEDSEEYINCSTRFIHALQEAHYFTEAEQLAQVVNANSHLVSINEWTVKAKGVEDFGFWMECFKALEQAEIPYRSIISFAYKCFGEIGNPITKLLALVKVLELGVKSRESNRKIMDCERHFWDLFIKVQVEHRNTEDYSVHIPDVWTIVTGIEKSIHREITYQGGKDIPQSCKLKPTEVDGLDRILEKLFKSGCIQLAFHVSDLFCYQSRDLDIVYMSHTMAQGCVGDTSCSPTIQSLMSNISSAYAVYDEGINSDDTEIIEMLSRLQSLSTYGHSACQWVILHYKIASLLHLSYNEVVRDRDKLKLLKTLISSMSHSSDALSLAKELITVIGINDDCVADFICAGILDSITARRTSDASLAPATDSNPSTSSVAVLRLLNNSSILGKKLLGSITDNTLSSIAVEVYIRAHDCFTLSSDIEGIAIVLRNVKTLVMKTLRESNDYHSMIRLLTGIARYSEMTYIFDILREDEEFEMLLGKGIEKVPQLRIALMDFLQKDKEMFPMIAFNFSMHREIAEMMEISAAKSLKGLHLGRQQSFMSYKTTLEKILQDLIDASESYTKAGCYTKSDRCSRLAQLVALQVNYLPSGIVVLNLAEAAVSDLVAKHNRFFEAYIIAEGYQHHRSWNLAILNNVILRGDWTYFKDLRSQIQLTTTNFDEIVALYQKVKAENPAGDKLWAAKQNIQTLLTYMKDIKKQYEYSVELQLTDLTRILMRGENGGFLSDLMQQNQIRS